MVSSCSWLTGEPTVVVGAGRVLLVRAERRAGGGAGAEAGVAQGRAHFTGVAAVVDWPLNIQGRRQRGALLGLGKEKSGLVLVFRHLEQFHIDGVLFTFHRCC